jgi:Tol biopolymer transport system component
MTSGRSERLTFDEGDEFAPVWAPDGRRLLFSSMTKGLVDLRLKDLNRAGEVVRLEVDQLGLGRYAMDWSRDGRFILYIGGARAIARSDLWVAPVASPREARALLDSPFVETQAHLSPRGDWFVYGSNETGRLEVYADRFPQRGAKTPVSTNGGGWPRWASDGSEIYYLSPKDDLMSVPVRATRDRLDLGSPRALFRTHPRPPARLDAYAYDVSPDGKRFIVNTLIQNAASTSITLVQNWRSSQKP